jgi:outer membrane receptor for ferrienterochelin and colicin
MVARSHYAALVTTALVSSLAATPAFAQAQVNFNLPAQELATSLKDVARATNTNVVFDPREIAGKRAPAVTGSYTAEGAIARAIGGSPLTVKSTGSGTFVVSAVGNGIGGDAEDAPSKEYDATNAKDQAIVVTGSNIRGVKTAAPRVTITNEDIRKRGYTSLRQVLESLPQNLNEVSSTSSFGAAVSSAAGANFYIQGSSASLRGLGPGSTLSLINGKRGPASAQGINFDASLIPLVALDQVEVVTGGQSSIYGSDAVAGVINYSTLRDFDGAETRITGELDANGFGSGGNKLQFSQLLGKRFSRGGFVLAYQFDKQYPFDYAKTDVGKSEFAVRKLRVYRRDIKPSATQNSGYLSGHYDLSDVLRIRANAMYADRNQRFLNISDYNSNTVLTDDRSVNTNEYLVQGTAEIALSPSWQLTIAGEIGRNKNIVSGSQVYVGGFSAKFPGRTKYLSDIKTVSMLASGPLFPIGGGEAKAAVGAEWRKEGTSFVFKSPTASSTFDRNREITSAFAELNIPIVGNGPFGIRHFEVTASGRYDDYSQFGSVFKPQVGAIWDLGRGLSLRGTYAQSFRAPDFTQLRDTDNQISLNLLPDSSSPSGKSTVFTISGGRSDLEPETAKSWTLNAIWQPEFMPSTRISVAYYNIHYSGRVGTPITTFADFFNSINQSNLYGDLISRNPSAASIDSLIAIGDDSGQLTSRGGLLIVDYTTLSIIGLLSNPVTGAKILAYDPRVLVLDRRTTNIGVEAASGLDFQLDFHADTGKTGELSARLNATYNLRHYQRVTPTAGQISQLNQVGKPVDFRFTGNLGWRGHGLDVNAFLNYVGHYKNTLVIPNVSIDPWVTVDLSVGYQFPQSPIRGLSAQVTAQNLFNAEPQILRGGLASYDPVNSNVFGRTVLLSLKKLW